MARLRFLPSVLVLLSGLVALSSGSKWSPPPAGSLQHRLMEESRAYTNTTYPPYQPQQVHLVFGADFSEYVVQWVTFDYNTSHSSYVQYGYSPDGLAYSSFNTPYNFTDLRCSTTRLMHNVTMVNLTLASTVYYRVSSDSVHWSDVGSFVVLDRSNTTRPWVISLAGDVGLYPDACNVSSVFQWAADLQAGQHDFVIHYGDIAYNLDDSCNQIGDRFMNQAMGVGNATSYVYGPGNHETDAWYTYYTYTSRYAGQTPMAQQSSSPSVRWFSFDVGMIHFVMFDTDAWIYLPVMPLAQPQYEWMAADLAKVDRTRTPWLIVIGHRAMYCTKNTDPECNGEAETIRNGFFGTDYGIEPLLLQYGADMYFAGHTHHYMRTWPVSRNKLVQANYTNPGGPIHIQSGIGAVDGDDPFELPMKVYDAWRDENYYVSFSRLTVHNATDLTFTQHRADNGEVIDTFHLHQDKHGPFQY